ncbi:hypothetical protein [Streptomyces sp. NPDC001315]|uniref:hypothetical protein n=1 Tax=Streptomyces sp. NPDC001315 TaxID=3364562 RepID=UPI0036CD1BCD
MSVPRITLTMLGATSCGKTTYLHGMYARLSQGFNGYFLYATDPDADLDLADAWTALSEEGTFPRPNDVNKPVGYEFRFLQGVLPLLEIDCLDFRGGAGTDRGNREDSPEDIAMLRERIEVSDAIFLVLDGQHVGQWIADGARPHVNPATDPMRIATFSRAINFVIGKRRETNEPPPSLVVLVTKTDLLPQVTGMSTREALATLAKNLTNLVQLVAADGVSAMLCPVQIGNFGEATGPTVNPSDVDPRYVHNPIIFALLHYLTEGITRHEQQIREVGGQIDRQGKEVATLSAGLFGGFFKRGEMKSGNAKIDAWREELRSMEDEVSGARKRAESLAEELHHMPIYRSGKLQEA